MAPSHCVIGISFAFALVLALPVATAVRPNPRVGEDFDSSVKSITVPDASGVQARGGKGATSQSVLALADVLSVLQRHYMLAVVVGAFCIASVTGAHFSVGVFMQPSRSKDPNSVLEGSTSNFVIQDSTHLRSNSWAALGWIGVLLVLCALSASVLWMVAQNDGRDFVIIRILVMVAFITPAAWLAKLIVRKLVDLVRRATNVRIVAHSKILPSLEQELGPLFSHKDAQAISWRGMGELFGKKGNAQDSEDHQTKLITIPTLNNERFNLVAGGERMEVLVQADGSDARHPELPREIVLLAKSAGIMEFIFCGIDCTCYLERRIESNQRRVHDCLAAWLASITFIPEQDKRAGLEVYELDLQPGQKAGRAGWTLSDSFHDWQKQSHYIPQPWASRAAKLVEFTITQKSSTVCLFVSGAKGSGKTSFVKWLASLHRLPIYSISLTDARLKDATICQCMSVKGHKHPPPVIFHIDEFQVSMDRWQNDNTASGQKEGGGGVTIGGFQAALEGVNSASHKIVVITSSAEFPDLHSIECPRMRDEVAGLARRLQYIIKIPPLDCTSTTMFLDSFLSSYGLTSDWASTQSCDVASTSWSNFAAAWANWDARAELTFDAVRKYAEERVHEAFVDGLFGPAGILPEKAQQVVSSFLDPNKVKDFLRNYAGGMHGHLAMDSLPELKAECL